MPPSIKPIALPRLHCRRCDYRWVPRLQDVRICPACKSARWDQPNCRALTPRELNSSDFAAVNYYRCGECGHVWTTDKRTNEILSQITPLRRKPAENEG